MILRSENILRKIKKVLRSEHGLEPLIYYQDTEGDLVSIKAENDVKYAIKNNNVVSNRPLRLIAKLNLNIHSVSENKPILKASNFEPSMKHSYSINKTCNLNKFAIDSGNIIWRKGNVK